MEEITLVLIKPDVNRNCWEEIKQIYLNQGLNVLYTEVREISRKTAEEFYQVHQGKPFFEGLIAHTISGPVYAIIIKGENAVARIREINGVTNPAEAKKGTIRYKYGIPNGGPKNAVHGSDSLEEAIREIKTIFNFDVKIQ